MRFRTTKYIRNREIHEEDVRRIWNFFAAMPQEQICDETGGLVGLTLKSDAYGEISGVSDDAIDEAMSRRMPIKEVVFRFRSKDFQSSMTLCLQDEFTGFFEFGHGGVFEIESPDRRWFDAMIRRFEDMVETLPPTPLWSRLLCRLRWFVSILIALGLSFVLVRILILNGLTCWALGKEYPELSNRILTVIFIFSIPVALFYDSITTFIRKNCPVVDLALFKKRAIVRQRCSKIFWWVISVLGASVIGLFLTYCKSEVVGNTGLPSITDAADDVQSLGQSIPGESNSKE